MPTYHVHDTTVKLYLWDPAQRPKASNNQETLFTSDPACRHDAEPLKEEYFEGQEGVHFLGSSMPFFLINAGRDLFFKTRQISRVSTEAESPVDQGQDEQVFIEDDSRLSDFLPTMPSNVSKLPTDIFDDPDNDSSLSSIPSSIFTESISPGMEESGSQSKSSRARKPRGWQELPFKHQGKLQNTVSKPITSAKPIKIQVDLSKKSFMKSLYTNNSLDICVNIFYNGEFVHSKVLRSRTATSYTAEEKTKHFCGRRIDNNHEIPWVVLPVMQDDASIVSMPPEYSSFEDRWNRVNQLLSKEADEWGRTGKYDMFRAPVGEYLEELSKKPIPESMKHQVTMGDKAGIIDVVISVGSSTTIIQWANLTKPRRKLPEDFCGREQRLYVVPEELNPQHRAQIIADFEREEIARSANRSITKQNPPTRSIEDEGCIRSRVVTTKIPLNNSADESAFKPLESSVSQLPKAEEQDWPSKKLPSLSQDTFLDNAAMQMQNEPSSSQPFALIMPSSRSLRGGSLPAMSSSPLMSRTLRRTRTNSTTTPTIPRKEWPRHPNRPRITPQKSYKGPSPSLTQQSVENPWEFLPFDAEKSVSHSTRSKRSTAIPVLTPENLRGQELVDSYLTLRNRQLGAVSSIPLERSPLSKFAKDSVTSTPGASFGIDSSSCKPPSKTDRCRELNLRTYEDEDVSMDGGLEMNDNGDAQKTRSDARMASEGTPTRSSKRKRPSSGSHDRSLSDGDDSSIQQSKSAKRSRFAAKDNKGSGETTPIVESESRAAGRISAALTGTTVETEQQYKRNQFEEEPHKKQRRPSKAMSARELNGLLTPHKPTKGVNTSFGASFAASSSSRYTRNQPSKDAAGETGAEIPKATTKVTATYKKKILVIKGLKGTRCMMPNQLRAERAIDVTRADIVPALRIEDVKRTAKPPKTQAETTQLKSAFQPPQPNVPKGKVKAAPKQITGPVEIVRAASSTAPVSAKSRKEPQMKNSKTVPATAARSEPTVSKNINQGKANNSKEVLAKTTKSETAQANFKQGKVKNQELGTPSTSVYSAQAARNNKVKTEKLRELGRNSRSEPIPQNLARSEKTKVSTLQGPLMKPLPGLMAPPPTKALEKIEQPAALLQKFDLDSGLSLNLAPNITKASSVEEANMSSALQAESNPMQITKDTANAIREKVVTTKPKTKELHKGGKENVKRAAVQSSTNIKPNLMISPELANARSSRSYNTTSQGMKTPTPRSGTFATPKNSESSVSLARTRSSSITMKDTPGSGSTTVMEEMPTVQASQGSNKPPKPARGRPPLLTLVPNSTTIPSATTATTAMTTPPRLNSTVKDPPPQIPSTFADPRWKPNSLCTASVLSYATPQIAEPWSEKEYHSQADFVSRNTMVEREAVFRANGILMGVRFVLGVGRDEDEVEVEMKG